MKLENVKKVAVLGGGVMGGGIAQVTATGGYEVVIRDINSEVIEATRESIFDGKWGLKRAVERGKLPFDAAVEAMQKISFTTQLSDIADVDLIIEAIPEKLELKQQVFQELDGVVKPEAIFASNTSGFAIEDVARDVSDARKANFVGMHYSNPVVTMKMLEVIYTPQTSQDTIDTAVGLGEAQGKAISMVKDAPGTYGFLLNRIFGAAYREAKAIADAGIATEEDIDKAMITGRNWPAGFFGRRGGIGKEW
ncbi:MAG: 3-hydroxyacyl-CoA dehydrogenase family protein [Dehalococcoidia bacterium]|nr:3-hydroxyacyl-CoA dehydrogenase family protein [Dehalococcoidia bacterium]MCA9824999.1 3-hydroxyacyl-CoA dehydrogenase family protein [Dehalococcoidia bacterium]MCA9843789.1 3-hydroxyacyl-CoA dehydrogenase family protein [Dehalococcoidia bacterium]MCA9855126.1 3-hydroxyacyl-CoA dehydrogenase family protein [Dehalococcoidia bacterium]